MGGRRNVTCLGWGWGGGKEKEEDLGWDGQNLALGLRRGEKGGLCAPKRRLVSGKKDNGPAGACFNELMTVWPIPQAC